MRHKSVHKYRVIIPILVVILATEANADKCVYSIKAKSVFGVMVYEKMESLA
jgi:hypothetical protein